MKSKLLIEFAKKTLKELLSQCTPEEQFTFRRMYSPGDMNLTINDVVEQMNSEKYDWAICQCEVTIEKRKNNGS